MIRVSNIAPMAVLFLCFMNVWRAYFLDSLNILVFITLVIFGAAAIRIALLKEVRIPNFDVVIAFTLILLMIGFIANYKGGDVLKDIFLYHLTALLFLPFLILLAGTDPKKTVLIVFSVIFWVDSFVIVIELMDGLVGLDVHRVGLFNWYIEINDPGRFLQLKLNSASFYGDLPAVLGLRGYPNYSAPLFTASFVFLLAVKYSEKVVSLKDKSKQILFFAFGSCLVLVLGVKTHFVTLAISLIFISIYLNRVMFRHAFIGCLLLAVFALSTEVGSDRIMVLYEQLFEGGYQAIESREGGARVYEPGRLETIFNWKAYASFLDLSFQDFVFGASNFLVLGQWDIFFEQKILVIGLVLGAPFVVVFLVMSSRAILNSFKSMKMADSKLDKGFYCGLLLAVLVLLLEVGHFGSTFYYPNFQVLCYLIAVSVVCLKNIGKLSISNT